MKIQIEIAFNNGYKKIISTKNSYNEQLIKRAMDKNMHNELTGVLLLREGGTKQIYINLAQVIYIGIKELEASEDE